MSLLVDRYAGWCVARSSLPSLSRRRKPGGARPTPPQTVRFARQSVVATITSATHVHRDILLARGDDISRNPRFFAPALRARSFGAAVSRKGLAHAPAGGGICNEAPQIGQCGRELWIPIAGDDTMLEWPVPPAGIGSPFAERRTSSGPEGDQREPGLAAVRGEARAHYLECVSRPTSCPLPIVGEGVWARGSQT